MHPDTCIKIWVTTFSCLEGVDDVKFIGEQALKMQKQHDNTSKCLALNPCCFLLKTNYKDIKYI